MARRLGRKEFGKSVHHINLHHVNRSVLEIGHIR